MKKLFFNVLSFVIVTNEFYNNVLDLDNIIYFIMVVFYYKRKKKKSRIITTTTTIDFFITTHAQ